MNFKILNGPLDPDEREAYIQRKIIACENGYRGVPFKDPVLGMISELKLPIEHIKNQVEPWLTPTPPLDMLFMLTVENFVTFIDTNGCLDYANQLSKKVKSDVLPDMPVLFGVDHSLSGGVISALCEEHGGENLRLIVFDSHFDFIPPTIRCGLIQYDVENNPETKFSPKDPYIYNRPDSYNADSFLSYVGKRIPMENIYVVGVSDYPPRAAEEIEDERVRRYIEFYKGIESSGVHVIKKEDIQKDLNSVRSILSRTNLPLTYVSVDVDVCANISVKGARFLDYFGITHKDLYDLIASISKSNSKIVGIDFMEFDVYNAGSITSGRQDRTYAIMAESLRRIIFNK
ncbi:MAG: arginase family protein [Candidatus Methanomethyliaceae archaeon]|nr:arginase family protein [Candidatus Methanomethyliaceae archaeon]